MQDTGRFLSEIDNTLPSNQDPRAEGAGQIRNLKTALLNTFPYLTGENTVDTRPFTPLGAIMMYSGSKDGLTTGWEMCDGERTVNGIKVPDLRGRFIMGATTSELTGATGGANKYGSKEDPNNFIKVERTEGHKLTINEMPSHSHQQVRGQQTGDSYWNGTDTGMIHGVYQVPTSKTGGDQAHSHSLQFDNRPAYYALAYIIYVGMPIE